MADFPFAFGGPQAAPPPAGADAEGIRNQWTNFLDQPGARPALLSMGIALMQPPSFGDTPTSQIGRAIGAGGEAATTGEALASKEAEQGARAEASVAKAGQAGERLLRLEDLRNAKEQGNELQLRKLYLADQANQDKAYQAAHKEWQKAMSDFKLTGLKGETPPAEPQKPAYMSYEQWAATKGGGALLGGPSAGRKAAQPPPAPDEVRNGYRFKGGNPANPQNWEEVK
jgi:hypothetical protein